MNTNEVFLQEFRRVESTLRNKYNISYLTFEESAAPANWKPKMQVCRIMRNYLSHEEDGAQFICASFMQIKFLQDMNKMLLSLGR